MNQCPSCHGQIELTPQHSGTLFSCPLCHAVFFVGWDGQPELAEPHPIVTEETPHHSEFSPGVIQEIEPNEPVSTDEPVFESPPTIEESIPHNFDQPLNPDSFSTLNSEDSSSQILSPDQAMAEIESFANDNQPAGPLTYSVIIEGIDLKDQYQELKEALSDVKFNWSVDEILALIKNGRLEMSAISPIKASLLIQRIQSCGLDIRWRQNV